MFDLALETADLLGFDTTEVAQWNRELHLLSGIRNEGNFSELQEHVGCTRQNECLLEMRQYASLLPGKVSLLSEVFSTSRHYE